MLGEGDEKFGKELRAKVVGFPASILISFSAEEVLDGESDPESELPPEDGLEESEVGSFFWVIAVILTEGAEASCLS